MKDNRFIERSLMGAVSFLKESVFADEHAGQKGFLQARDPRVKVAAILLLVLSVLFSRQIAFIGGIYLVSLVLAGCSSINLAFFLGRTWLFVPLFAIFIVVPSAFSVFTPGEQLAVIKIGVFSFQVTKQGIAGASIFFSRVLVSVSLCVLLSLTTRHYALLKVLRIFRVPQVFVMTLGMCYRYIFLFIGIIQDTYTAIKSRCGYGLSSMKGQKIVAWSIAALWQRSYRMQNQVYDAMLSRGYSGEVYILDDLRAGIKDILFLAGATVIFLLIIWRTYFSN
ncbi:MAG: cobalt ECF transporter T component CbiQ [Candidatus Omnitrophota bacterium]|jgi:cobalt/nickel transport system permease protein